MKNILIVSGHTNTVNDSVANVTIMQQLETALPDCRTVYLDRLYPDFRIDVKAEQEKLLWADIIVLQFPVFWFSMPSLLHRWMEETFLHGFSHGSTGDKLRGKTLVVSYTTGAPADMLNWEDFMGNLRATCQFTGMNWGGCVGTGGVSYQMRNDPEQLAAINTKACEHATRLLEHLKAL
ncbi:MAG: NAD(P)H-dependent oxidoreductase [Akkermansia sp.]|nr:NAD(P)H-dependent oxidoreductase [Akkermansia sp.]